MKKNHGVQRSMMASGGPVAFLFAGVTGCAEPMAPGGCGNFFDGCVKRLPFVDIEEPEAKACGAPTVSLGMRVVDEMIECTSPGRFIVFPVFIELSRAPKSPPQMLFSTVSFPMDFIIASPFFCSEFHREGSRITSAFVTCKKK
jgi:hypothetical protein